ncbi:MAG: glycosyltransferase [Chitinivibrionales bacterium]|nr:glycosyltransferase [Chitinivibrionales bacterium]
MIALGVLIALYVVCSATLLMYGIQCYTLTFLFARKRSVQVKKQNETVHYYDAVDDPARYPKVVTQLPMYNEKAVAVRAIRAVAAMQYPGGKHEIQVLDDSNDETIKYVDDVVAELKRDGVLIEAIRRNDRTGFKAGALQNGLSYTDAEFVAIFDADFVPHSDYLLKTMAFFAERPRLGLVQARWTHLNPKSSLVTRVQAMGIDGHFMVEQAARSWNDLFMNFNGTAGIFRRAAIEDAGGWQHDTLTEDMDLSYRMQLKDWQTEYVPEIEVPAEIPEDINAFKNQQFRWAKGSIQTAIKIIPMLLEKKIRPFKLVQAILHLTHYTVHPLMLLMAILSMPILYFIKVTLSPFLFVLVVASMLIATSGPSVMYMLSQHYLGNRGFKKFFFIPIMMFIGTGLAVNNGKAVLEALFRVKSPFHRTPKKGEKKGSVYKPLKEITNVFELLLGMYCVLSVYMFFGYTNFIVSPFLMLYASGFIFVGLLSILHFRNPGLIDLKVGWIPGMSSKTA